MKAVKHPVHDRRQHNTDGGNEYYAAHQCINRGEPFAGIRRDYIGRSHPRQDHGGIEQAVQPGEPTGSVVAQNADAQEKT